MGKIKLAKFDDMRATHVFNTLSPPYKKKGLI